MPVKMEQPKKNQAPVSELIRQSSRRVKEMDLTAEEKVNVMAMIKDAKAAEKAGDLKQALKLYNELRRFLDEIKEESEDAVKKTIKFFNNKELKKYQSDLAWEELLKIKADTSLDESDRIKLWDQAYKQLDIINLPEKEKIKKVKSKAELYEIRQFLPQEIVKVISELKKIDIRNLYIIKCEFNNDGDVVNLELGDINDLKIKYVYMPAGENVKFSGNLEASQICEQGALGSLFGIALWSEFEQTWKDRMGNVIEFENK